MTAVDVYLEVGKSRTFASALAEPTSDELVAAPWLAFTRRCMQPGMTHEMDDIRAAVAQAWACEVAEKRSLADPKR